MKRRNIIAWILLLLAAAGWSIGGHFHTVRNHGASGGQRQRIAIVRNLIRKAHGNILGEGTSTLDETNALEVDSILITQDSLGGILITHNLRKQVKTKLTDTFMIAKH